MPTQVVLAFERRKLLYDKLGEVSGLDAIVVYGQVLKLSDDPELSSRFSERIKNLGVHAHSVQPLLDWFNTELRQDVATGISLVHKFNHYFLPLLEEGDNQESLADRREEMRQALLCGVGHITSGQHDSIGSLLRVACHLEKSVLEATRQTNPP